MVQAIPSCTCAAGVKIMKFLEDQRLIQMLMGLDESFKVTRGQILMMKPLPTFSTAYSLILQEERQRGIHMSMNLNSEAIVMHVTSVDSNNHFTKKPFTSNHFKKTSHVNSQCYRLHEFHVDIKFTKNKRDDHKSSVQNLISTFIPSTSTSVNNLNGGIFRVQYQSVMELLSKNGLGSTSRS